jgi:hypothetical protein
MALAAIRAELVVMGVCVAIRTRFVLDAFEFLELQVIFHRDGMAFDTNDLLVHPLQLEGCSSMIEFYRRFERIEVMAVGTAGRERFLVIIGMTG